MGCQHNLLPLSYWIKQTEGTESPIFTLCFESSDTPEGESIEQVSYPRFEV